MLAAGMLSFTCGEERREVSQPFLAAGRQIARSERVSELLQPVGRGALQKGIAKLLERNALLSHAIRQPVMLIETNPGGEWEIGADAYEHSSPYLVIDVEIVLGDPAIRDLKMPSVCGLISDSDHDTRRLSCFEDDDDLIGLGPFEIWVDEFVATAPRRFYDRDLALCRSLRYPALELFSDVAQSMARHWV